MKKILIVEDHADVRRLLGIVLRREDRQLFLVESGEEAVETARQIIPDVILQDVMLPGELDGYDVVQVLKNDPATAVCAIIIMTAKAQEQDRADAFEAGADDYIGKPFSLVELNSKVDKFLK